MKEETLPSEENSVSVFFNQILHYCLIDIFGIDLDLSFKAVDKAL